jgi:NADH:ubiquinone oxidoreductase subunit C
MKDFLNYYSKNLILHIYKFSGLNKIVISGLDISKFLLKRSKYSSLIEYSLIDDNFDETNLRFKEIIEYRDYKNKFEIGFISKNSENERNSLSEIVVSAYSAERENFDLYGVTYRRDKDLRRILTSYGLQGSPLRNYCTTTAKTLAELELKALQEIISYNIHYLEIISGSLNIDNQYGFKQGLLSDNDHDLLRKYVAHKDVAQVENFCINQLRKSEQFRKWILKELNSYKYSEFPEEDLVILTENAFVACGHLPNVQKYLEYSKLKLNTLDDFCQGIIEKIDSDPQAFQDLCKAFLSESTVFLLDIYPYQQERRKDLILLKKLIELKKLKKLKKLKTRSVITGVIDITKRAGRHFERIINNLLIIQKYIMSVYPTLNDSEETKQMHIHNLGINLKKTRKILKNISTQILNVMKTFNS